MIILVAMKRLTGPHYLLEVEPRSFIYLSRVTIFFTIYGDAMLCHFGAHPRGTNMTAMLFCFAIKVISYQL